MTFLQTIHGELRWLVALVALIAIVKFALGWVRDEEYTSLDRGLMTAFTVTLDINLLLGLILLFGLPGGFPMFRIEHATTMILAVVAGHASAAWRNSPDDKKKFRNNLGVIVLATVLVVVGVLRLRGGWVW